MPAPRRWWSPADRGADPEPSRHYRVRPGDVGGREKPPDHASTGEGGQYRHDPEEEGHRPADQHPDARHRVDGPLGDGTEAPSFLLGRPTPDRTLGGSQTESATPFGRRRPSRTGAGKKAQDRARPHCEPEGPIRRSPALTFEAVLPKTAALRSPILRRRTPGPFYLSSLPMTRTAIPSSARGSHPSSMRSMTSAGTGSAESRLRSWHSALGVSAKNASMNTS
jgi:hypothetical protein